MSGYNKESNARVMWTSGAADGGVDIFAYPTGAPLGLIGGNDAAAADVIGYGDGTTTNGTATTTNTSSPFHLHPTKTAVLRSFTVLATGSGGTPSFKLQDHGGQKDLTPTYSGATMLVPGMTYWFKKGLVLNGGFRVLSRGSTNTPVIEILYEIQGR